MSDVNYSPRLEPYLTVSPFKAWCQKVIPAVYDGSITIYEMMCKLTTYINQIIDNMDGQQTDITNLLDAYNQLQEYVNTYFDNLDLQQQINNWLDKFFKTGEIPKFVYPDIFTGETDLEKIQNCFDYAFENNLSILLNRNYSINGSIVIKKDGVARNAINIYGYGTITAVSNEPIFIGTDNSYTGDINFIGCSFIGNGNNSVFYLKKNESGINIIRISTISCMFKNFKHVYYSEGYIQSIRSTCDSFVNITGECLKWNGIFYDLEINNILFEESETGCLFDCTKKDSIISGHISGGVIEDVRSKPPIHLTNCQCVKISDIYFEANKFGDINVTDDCNSLILDNIHSLGDSTHFKISSNIKALQFTNNIIFSGILLDLSGATIEQLIFYNNQPTNTGNSQTNDYIIDPNCYISYHVLGEYYKHFEWRTLVQTSKTRLLKFSPRHGGVYQGIYTLHFVGYVTSSIPDNEYCSVDSLLTLTQKTPGNYQIKYDGVNSNIIQQLISLEQGTDENGFTTINIYFNPGDGASFVGILDVFGVMSNIDFTQP